MPPGWAVDDPVGERRLAHEQIGVAREPGELGARGRVAGVRDRLAAVGDTEAVRLEVVVRKPICDQFEARRLEGLLGLELLQLERVLEHVRIAPEGRERGELVGSSRRYPERAGHSLLLRSVLVQPRPWDEIAPVVEMKVRDRDRINRQAVLPQAPEHAGTTVEQKILFGLEEIAGLRAARVRPRR